MLKLAGFEVQGLSRGGIETCIDLPRLKLCFDIGRCPPEAVSRPTVLFTHAHMDHMGGVAYHAATRALYGMAPPLYVIPPENAQAFEDLFAVWRRLDRSDLEHRTVALGPGEELELHNKLLARPFRSPHRVPCQGYGLWSRKRKLRPELEGLGPEQVRARKQSGADPTVTIDTPEIAFTGDSLIEVVEREEVVRKARLLIMEVTFLDGRVPVAQCRSKGHIHLDEVAERADLFENEALLLTHFSARYTPQEVRRLLEKRLPARLLERVHTLDPAREDQASAGALER